MVCFADFDGSSFESMEPEVTIHSRKRTNSQNESVLITLPQKLAVGENLINIESSGTQRVDSSARARTAREASAARESEDQDVAIYIVISRGVPVGR